MTAEIPVSRNKIVVPALRPEILHRARLLGLMDDLLDKKLFLLVAPAGYGKTSLLVDFAHQSEMPVCWLSLDTLDQDPQRFCIYLIAALELRYPKFGKLSKSVLRRLVNFEQDNERLLSVLVNEIDSQIDQHFILVLDDYQFVDAIPEVRNFFNRFIYLAGENCHIILSSRRLPTLPDITLMVARQQVSGFDLEELAFRPNEIRSLFEMNYGMTLEDGVIDKLMQRTEGWITGLRLSASSVAIDLPDLTRSARATGVNLAEYINQQVLAPQPPALRRFLLQSSLLEEFDVGLCEAVLGKGDWKSFVNTVRRDNLFVLPVGPEGNWLRYHPIIQEFLQQCYREEEPEMARAIQFRLAKVYEERGEVEKAYAIYRQSEDTEQLARLIERVGTSMILNERLITFRSWLAELPNSQFQARPILLSLKGALLCALGDEHGSLSLLDQATLEFRKTGDLKQLTLALVRRAATRRLLGDYAGSLLDSDEVLQLSEKKPELAVAYAEAERFKGICYYHLGQVEEAARIQKSALQHYQHLGEKQSIARVQMELGMTYRAGGNYSSACEVYQASMVEWRSENNLYSQADVHNSLGVLYHAQGEYEKAVREFEEGLDCIGKMGSARLEAFLLTSLGDLLIDLDEFSAAEKAFYKAILVLQGTDFQFLYNYLCLAQVRLARHLSHYREARQNLNTVESFIRNSSSNYEYGLFLLERGCLKLSEQAQSAAIADLELALEYFQRGHLIAEAACTRIWLVAATSGSQGTPQALSELQAVLGKGLSGPLFNSLLQVVRRSLPWLAFLHADEGIAAILAPWMDSITKFEMQLPALRRRLRRVLTTVTIENPGLSIRAFGKTQVRIRGKPLTSANWKTASVRELFFFLLTAQRPLSKDVIGDTLWPELDTAHLKLRFKNDLYRLRRALGQEIVLFEENTYRFNHQIDYDLDVENFTNAINEAKEAEGIDERISLLRNASRLRVGPYLQDIDSTWVIPERVRLDRICVEALKQLAEAQRQTGDLPAAVQACQEALNIDSCREDIHRLAMQLYAMQGNRLAIIWQYQACRDNLHNELNVHPSRDTEEMYQKLVS